MRAIAILLLLGLFGCGKTDDFKSSQWTSLPFTDLHTGESITEVWSFSSSLNEVTVNRLSFGGRVIDSNTHPYTLNNDTFLFNDLTEVKIKKASTDKFEVISYGLRNYSGPIVFIKAL